MIAFVAGVAGAGELEGEVALDALHATSTSAEPNAGDGALSATELGMRIRGEVEQGRFLGAVDYQGREPIAGEFRDEPSRLLYQAEVLARVVDGKLTVGVGRFLAPSVVFLPVDGARLGWTPSDHVTVGVFGGRRGVSTSREELGFDAFLPAVGASVGAGTDRVHGQLQGALAGDEVTLGTPESPDPEPDTFTAFNGTLSAWGRPADSVTTGLSATFAQRATYVLTASPVAADVSVDAADLLQGLVWASWDPVDTLGVDADVIHQSAELSEGPPPGADPAEVVLVDPTFTDVRLRAHGRVADAAWLRPDVRLRMRGSTLPDVPRTELRFGGAADLDRLPIPGWFLHGELFLDDILEQGQQDDVGTADRLLWVASTGYSREAIEVEGGASFVDRALAPVSSRSAAATVSDDLSPFVLEAQNIVFVRGFWTNRTVFGGADLEVSTTDPEVRAFLQVGVVGDRRW